VRQNFIRVSGFHRAAGSISLKKEPEGSFSAHVSRETFLRLETQRIGERDETVSTYAPLYGSHGLEKYFIFG